MNKEKTIAALREIADSLEQMGEIDWKPPVLPPEVWQELVAYCVTNLYAIYHGLHRTPSQAEHALLDAILLARLAMSRTILAEEGQHYEP